MNKQMKFVSYKNRVADLVVIFGAWITSYYLRFVLDIGGKASDLLLERYLGFGFLLVIISLVTFKNLKVYELNRFENAAKELTNLGKAHAISFVIFLAFSFFISHERLSRIMLAVYFVLSIGGLICIKLYFRNKILSLPVKLVLIGNGESIKKYFSIIKSYPNYKVLAWYEAPEEGREFRNQGDFSAERLEKDHCDGVVLGFNTKEANRVQTYLDKLADYIIPTMVLPDVQYAKLGYSIQNFKGIPVLNLNEPNVKTLGIIMKRVFDFVSCSVGLILISPLLLLIALAVKLTSKGPVFYGQVRMGVDGKEFKMWKFRSMVTGEVNTEGWTVKDDPRVTKVGKFLRKTSLDEFPQLWNVVVGDMSLVGPRPERPVFVEQFRTEIPNYMLRHKFKAGITGWAQINGWRGDTSIEKRIECDIWYIKNWSFALDVSIIFLTFWKGFINKNAY